MQVEAKLRQAAPGRDTLLTIGVFDGVHLGHQRVIQHLRQRAAGAGLLAGVVTFQHHPRRVLSSDSELPYLTSLEERVGLIRGLGVELVVVLPFTLELARLSAREFLELLKQHLLMKGLVGGADFALGRGREGQSGILGGLGEEMGFSFEVVSPVASTDETGEVVSSTAVRKALAGGDVARVARLLGRPFSLGGPVVPGDERGRKLGFPTANLATHEGQALPADGVYATRTFVDGRAHRSLMNIGLRPTFGGGERTVEVFILDFAGDLYARHLRVEVVEWLRGERKFDSPEELKAELARNVERAREILAASEESQR
jgi:riboflavin kinase/FMN adenylyltransferase